MCGAAYCSERVPGDLYRAVVGRASSGESRRASLASGIARLWDSPVAERPCVHAAQHGGGVLDIHDLLLRNYFGSMKRLSRSCEEENYCMIYRTD